ncbi:hypothetical protein QO009_003044 [Brevibacillus aydinogluensis]|uniref:type IV secretory system conjugative DNA transfer family protein n=1 Tax=Brevibacillus aydinogluensis TaxID=927786 RepID=UPI002892A9D9|nr:TraM recognition domain-containing protein [Brevibacillus aydinogluensis]MDT3417149.1 hypothetical protein [Brevibacillus aydinogluensis]
MSTQTANPLNYRSPLIWGGDDAFTHSLWVGPTRCGKTATLIKPFIYQILLAKRRGKPVGLTLIEPKGDVVAMVKEMCDAMEIDCQIVDPKNLSISGRFNVMTGDIDVITEATVSVLKSMFGKQEAFFSTVQELSSRNVTKLLKELYNDDMDIMDVLRNLRDEKLLKQNVEQLESRQGETELVQFFKHELLGDGDLAKKYRQFVIGLRAQLENLTSNRYLKSLITGKSTINLDKHYESGGVLAINTALDVLGTDVCNGFGQFFAMHLQLATYRRGGTERDRIPNYAIQDEASRYITPALEGWLSIAAEYRVAGIFALQSLGQLEVESGKLTAKAMKRAIMASCRNKIAFGGLEYEDAEEFAKIFGKDKIRTRQNTYEGGLIPHIFPKTYRYTEKEEYRFPPTFIMDGLPRFHFIHKLLKNGHPQKPGIAQGSFVPKDWKERLVEETKPLFDLRRISGVPGLSWLTKRQEEKRKQEAIKVLQDDPFATIDEPEKPDFFALPTVSLEEQNKRKFEEWLAQNVAPNGLNLSSTGTNEQLPEAGLKGGEEVSTENTASSFQPINQANDSKQPSGKAQPNISKSTQESSAAPTQPKSLETQTNSTAKKSFWS